MENLEAWGFQHLVVINDGQEAHPSIEIARNSAFGLTTGESWRGETQSKEASGNHSGSIASAQAFDDHQQPLGRNRAETPVTVDIQSLLKVPDSNESSDSPPSSLPIATRARSASTPLPPPFTAAPQLATTPSPRPTTATTPTLAPAAAILGGRQQVASVAPAVGTMYAAPAGHHGPPGPYSFLGGGGYAPTGAFFGGGGGYPGPGSADPRGSVGPGHGHGVGGSKRSIAPTSESPAKKQSKWSPEEDALIIELRGSSMKWEDISKRLPGRSAISCRLHYQNYLERRSEWDEERKNKLARLYER